MQIKTIIPGKKTFDFKHSERLVELMTIFDHNFDDNF